MPRTRLANKTTRTKRSSHMVTPPPIYPQDGTHRIALIQPASYGDNINSTLMFMPLRAKYPDAVIDVHTSTTYASAFYNNPLIDHLIEHKSDSKQSALHLVKVLPEVLQRSNYNHIYNPHPMINGDKWTSTKHPFSGPEGNLICAWIRALEDTDVPYAIPLTTILRLTGAEVANVKRYMQGLQTMAIRRNILMEVAGESGQTQWTDEWTDRTIRYLVQQPETNVFVSTRDNGPILQQLQQDFPGHVHFVGHLSIRECTELFNHCQVFLSVSSGLSNACNTNWAKKDIKWFETINSGAVSSGPIRSEGKTFWTYNNLCGYLNLLRDGGV